MEHSLGIAILTAGLSCKMRSRSCSPHHGAQNSSRTRMLASKERSIICHLALSCSCAVDTDVLVRGRENLKSLVWCAASRV